MIETKGCGCCFCYSCWDWTFGVGRNHWRWFFIVLGSTIWLPAWWYLHGRFGRGR